MWIPPNTINSNSNKLQCILFKIIIAKYKNIFNYYFSFLKLDFLNPVFSVFWLQSYLDKVRLELYEYLPLSILRKFERQMKINLFYFYIYPPDSQESDGGAIHRTSSYLDQLPEMPRHCCPLVI